MIVSILPALYTELDNEKINWQQDYQNLTILKITDVNTKIN